MSGGGNLSTDSSVRRRKRFQSALRKFQRFTGSLWAGKLSLGGVELSKDSSVRSETREGQVRVGADIPSVREETGYFLWIVQHSKVIWCCPGVQALTVRCFVVTPLEDWTSRKKVLPERFDTEEHGWTRERCRPSVWKWLQADALQAQKLEGQILWLKASNGIVFGTLPVKAQNYKMC